MRSNKKWHKLVFRQIQPIHIGKGSYGVVNETRIFIPGWTMWGALTKAYNLKNGGDLSKNQNLFENISCFYPSFDDNGKDENILFPKFDKGEFYLGNYSEDKFRAKFVDTFISTAINPGTNTASDESLHELNIILPKVKRDYRKNEKEEQIYWVGVIELEDNREIPDEIYIGGDVRYGFGKLMLINSKSELTEDEIKNWKQKGGYIPVGTHDNNAKIELLVEIEKSWEKAELRVKPRNKRFYYILGSKVKASENLKLYKGYFSK